MCEKAPQVGNSHGTMVQLHCDGAPRRPALRVAWELFVSAISIGLTSGYRIQGEWPWYCMYTFLEFLSIHLGLNIFSDALMQLLRCQEVSVRTAHSFQWTAECLQKYKKVF